MIRLADIWKGFREGDEEHAVLTGCDADIAAGELVSLLGPSGSGKSTLLNIISGIDSPDRGEVWVDGTSLTALDERRRTLFRRQHIGFVFQFFNLLPTLTVEENLLLPLELKGRLGTAERERARGQLEMVGLAGRAKAFPGPALGGRASSGVALARALVHDPLVILADEPTGNLDRETGQRVLDVLETLVREAGRTLVLVTHSREGGEPLGSGALDSGRPTRRRRAAAQMMSVLQRSSFRHLSGHPGPLLLAILGVSLGVAVVVAMDLAIQSSRQAFSISAETVSGRTTHQVVGGPAGLDEAVFTLLRIDAGVRESAPVVEGYASSDALPGRALRILGLDPFSELPFRPFVAPVSGGADIGSLIVQRGAVAISGETARLAGIERGDSLALRIGGGVEVVQVMGFLEPANELTRRGVQDLVVADVAEAQRLLGSRRPPESYRPRLACGGIGVRTSGGDHVAPSRGSDTPKRRGARRGHQRHDAGVQPQPHGAQLARPRVRDVSDLQHDDVLGGSAPPALGDPAGPRGSHEAKSSA